MPSDDQAVATPPWCTRNSEPVRQRTAPSAEQQASDERAQPRERCEHRRDGSASDLPRLDALEQALGPEHQHDRHHEVDENSSASGARWHRERARQADDQRADRRALDAAQAADDHHREARR